MIGSKIRNQMSRLTFNTLNFLFSRYDKKEIVQHYRIPKLDPSVMIPLTLEVNIHRRRYSLGKRIGCLISIDVYRVTLIRHEITVEMLERRHVDYFYVSDREHLQKLILSLYPALGVSSEYERIKFNSPLETASVRTF